MTNDSPQKHNTLRDWEQHLAPQVQQVELLGEITLTLEETQHLGQKLGDFIKLRRSWGVNEVCDEIHKKCPCAFIVFLVAQGVHDENAENGFWPDVGTTLGQKFDTNWHRQFGLLFEEILEANRLRLFPDAGGYRYVSRILLHGGIPNYSLGDYFQHLLRPAVTRPDYDGLSPMELIDEWLHHASGRYFSDKPVLRFLEFGGQVAVDFVQRTRDLAHEFLETNLVPPAEQAGLPERVIQGFHQWAVEERGFEKSDRSGRNKTGLRLRRPDLRYDPWGEGLSLDLLPQQIPATRSQASIRWEVRLDGHIETTLPVRLERVSYNLQTTAETLILERAIATCEVSLQLDGDTQRTWSLDLSGPLLAFDPSRESLLPWKTALPARLLWLLYPADATLEVTGPARKIAEFPPLPWGWAGFKGEAWDLSQATELTLRRGTETLLQVPVRSDEAAQRPHLVGGTLHQTFNLIGTPLYLGAPPMVRIPLVGRTSLDEELARWRLTLHNPWPAAPDLNLRRVPLTEFRSQLIGQEGYVDLPLEQPGLLGNDPMGSYIIRLRGPLGRDAELPLRLLPHLYLTGHERLYLSDPQSGPPEIELLVETPAGIDLEAQVEDNPCRVDLIDQEAERRTHQVRVPPATIEARLTVVKPQPDGEAIRVPLHGPLRRMRWTLTGDTDRADSQRLNWSGWPVKQSVDALEQTVAPVLFVDLGHTDAIQPDLRESLTLYLVDLEGRELQNQPFVKRQRDPGRSIWRFDLPAFLDTIRHNPSPVVRFELAYETGEESVRLPVISLTRSIHVEDVQVQIQETGLTTALDITWQEPVRLRHRRVRFWSVWQPWRPCREECIPDEAEGELRLAVAGSDFLVGKYLLEFLVVDPWTSPPPPIQPPPPGPNTAILELTPPAERLRQLEQGIQRTGPTFDLFLEHALVEADRGRRDQALTDLWQCYDWSDQAALPQLLAMVNLVEALDDKRLLTGLRFKMSKPERLRQILDDYEADRLSTLHFETYRNQLIRRSGLWPVDTCQVLLDFPYEPVQIYALMHLIRRGAQAGGEVILERIKNHRLSDIDGVDLFEINPDFAATFLTDRLTDPDVTRLFIRLTEREPERDWPVLIIRPGCFVRSRAGWGRIDKITVLDSGQDMAHFLQGETNVRLQLTLRPTFDSVPVTLEVMPDRQRLHFEPGLKLYECTKSKECSFISIDTNLLYNGHNRKAHGGIGAQHRSPTSPLLSNKLLEYRLRASDDMLS